MAQAGADTTAFLRSIELAAAELQRMAIDSGHLGAEAVALLRTCIDHHRAHAESLGARPAGPNVRFLAELTDRLAATTDQRTTLSVCLDAEEALAATYLASGDAELAAAIMPVESEHAVAIGLTMGASDDSLFGRSGLQTTERALDPTTHPPS